MIRSHTLLDGIVDYAGLFPPTAWPMERAVAEYGSQRATEWSWMLGAFVVPASRLDELHAARPDGKGRWDLSVLLPAPVSASAETARAFVAAHGDLYALRAVELRPETPADVESIAADFGDAVEIFCELSWKDDPAPWMPVLREAGVKAKIRTGGVTPDLIPPVDAVARFLRVCAEAGVGLKFTAGLHHPVRAEQALTYDDEPPRDVMHGFLNVFVAAGLLARGPLDDSTLEAVLGERDPSAFGLEPDGGVRWRDHVLSASDVAHARGRFARSFGSCSFAEPVDDLQTLDLT